MKQFTYKCEKCGAEFTIDKHFDTPCVIKHGDIIGGTLVKDISFHFPIVCSGICNRVWKPTAFVINGKK